MSDTLKNIRLFFKGVKIDERTENYINKRLEAVEKLLDKVLDIQVEIDLDKKGKFRVEIMIKTPFNLYRAEETTESIEGSMDIVANELKAQIKKHKGKRKTLMIRGGISLKKKTVVDKNARF